MSERSNSSGSLANSSSSSGSSNNNSSSNNSLRSRNNNNNSTESQGNVSNACDSSSEVSDEGYKSSQGSAGLRPKKAANILVEEEEEDQGHHTKLEVKETNDRPESSMTGASDDCSSTISSSDEDENPGAKSSDISEADLLSSPEPPKTPRADKASNGNSSDVTSLKKIEKPQQGIISSTTSSRLNNLMNSMKIPKFKRPLKTSSDSSSSNPVSPEIIGPPSPTRSLSGGTSSGLHWARPVRSRSISSEQGQGLLGGFSRSNPQRHSLRSNSSSGSGTTSRYMQAAEAYAAKNRAANLAKKQQQGGGTWSSGRATTRPALGPNTYTPTSYSRPASRTASASPGLQRRRMRRSASNTSNNDADIDINQLKVVPASTKSTPSKRPSRQPPKSVNDLGTAMDNDDDLILKRMEEILMTYKSKVEDHLAAEGRELPKEIFEDFTTQWVNEASSINQAIKGGRTSGPSSHSRSTSRQRRAPSPALSSTGYSRAPTPSAVTANWRKEHRDGQKDTKIPIPTFYNSPIPNETHI